MKIEKIKSRSVLFTFDAGDWDLNLQLILGRRYNYIIDTGLGSGSVSPILEYLGDNTKPIVVIITHHHWDHVWGNHFTRGCMIIAHRRCREILESEWDAMVERHGRYVDGQVEYCVPDLVFEEELYFPEDKIRLIYTPGHTIDGISVLDEEDQVLNAGDNIGDTMEELIPQLDTELELYQSTLKKYQQLDFDTCISGHNKVLGKDVIEKIMELTEKSGKE